MPSSPDFPWRHVACPPHLTSLGATWHGRYDLEKWVHSDVPMREYSFLDNPRIDAADLADVVRLKVRSPHISAFA